MPDSDHGTVKWPAIALGFLVAGWVAFLLTLDYDARMRARWGPIPDVVDALGQGRYIGQRTIPFLFATLFLDLLAACSLTYPSRPGWARVLKVVVAMLLVPTALVHGLGCIVTGFFAF